MRRAGAVLAAVLTAAASLLMVPVQASAAEGLRALVVPAAAEPGTTIRITGQNWPANGRLQAVTCGNLGRGGSPSCDLRKAYTVIANDEGAFEVYGEMGDPPVPCPCVMKISEADSRKSVSIPVTVTGHEGGASTDAPASAAPVPPLQVVTADLEGWGPPSAWFGGSPERTLALDLRNTTAAPLEPRALQLYAADGDGVGELVATTMLPALAPGELRRFEVPVALPAGVGTTQELRGRIAGADAFTVGTTTAPWGLALVVLALVAGLVALAVRRGRRRTPPPSGRHSQARVEQLA